MEGGMLTSLTTNTHGKILAHAGFEVKCLKDKPNAGAIRSPVSATSNPYVYGGSPIILFPTGETMDEQACYDSLGEVLHPEGLCCSNGHALPPDQAPHDRYCDPIFDHQCRVCGAVFSIFTDTIWSGSHYPCSTIVLIMHGIVRGKPTKHLAEELGVDRSHLLKRRHTIQKLALTGLPAIA